MGMSISALVLAGALAGAPAPATGPDAVAITDGARLYVCGRDEASRRAVRREHGRIEYISASELMSRGGKLDWAAPRCITPAEFARLQRMGANLRFAQNAGR